MDNQIRLQKAILSQETVASITRAAGIAAAVNNNIYKSVAALEPLQSALAAQSKAISNLAFSTSAASPIFKTSYWEGHTALARAAVESYLPALQAATALSKTVESVMQNFQMNLPAGFLPNLEGLIPSPDLAGALAGVSELITSGEISAEVVQEAEELTADMPMFFKEPNELANTTVDLALLLSSARVLVVAVCVIAVLGIFNREIDIEEAVLTLVLSFAGKDISGQVMDTVKKRRG